MAESAVARFQQIDRMFNQALDLPAGDRAGFVARESTDDPELGAEVRRLLDAHESSGGFLEAPAVEFAAPLLIESEGASSGAPQRVGPFRIVREIGHGGMGTVYLGERDDGQFEQRVALKLIRSGGHRGLIARFLEERRILALLEHPLIARLVDGGVTDDGMPWFAMEYVDGEPLDRYCDTHLLPLAQRLALFDDVCDAVQYAHQHLVVHRDLKPSNILVTADGQLKLLDFGIAKLVDPIASAEHREATAPTGLMAMTPEYAAPEQVQGRPVSTATDVYALGVVLYVLLTGQRPYEVRDRTPAEAERIICEVDPPRPSAVVGPPDDAQARARARARQTSPERQRRALHGDLDVIVMQALRKEPAKRYASAMALREDLVRYRQGMPVLARQGRTAYRLRKFVRRNAMPLALGAIAIVALSGAAIRENVLRAQAEAGTKKAEQTTDFMLGLFEASENGQSFGDTVTARALLARGLDRTRAMNAQPELQAQMLDVIGRLESQIGDYAAAKPLLEQALATRRSLHGENHADVATTLDNLADVAYATGDMKTAVRLRSEELAIRRRLYGNTDVKTTNTIFDLASDLHASGDPKAAQPLTDEWMAAVSKAPPEITPTRMQQASEMGDVFSLQNKFPAAETWYRLQLSIARQLYGERHEAVAGALSNLGMNLDRERKWQDAEPLMREAVDLRRAANPEGHPMLAQEMRLLSVVLEHEGKFREADSVLAAALPMVRRFRGDNATETINTEQDLAYALIMLGRYVEADSMSRQAIKALKTTRDDKSPFVLYAKVMLGDALRGEGKFAEAEPMLLACWAGLQKGRGPIVQWRTAAAAALFRLYTAEGKPEEAAKYRAVALQ